VRAGALIQPVALPIDMPHLDHSDTEPIARIDADNDDLLRYVVRRYAYDPQRRERRHHIVAAFDNDREWGAFLDQAAARLGQDRAAGLVTDPRDHYTGLVLEPGYQRRQQNARLIRRAIERGADISAFAAGLDLPSNMAIVLAGGSHDESA
jgi:GNAT superfamily N-acetyltransferase